jgi:hypothetical protein
MLQEGCTFKEKMYLVFKEARYRLSYWTTSRR